MKFASRNFYRQLYLAVAASLSYLTVGLVRGWSSTAIPSLQQSESAALIAIEENESWVSASPLLAAFFGSIIAGILLEKFGRKRTLLLSSPLFVIGWIFLGFSNSFTALLCARLLTGVCAGIVIPAAQLYVAECSQPDIRGILGSIPALFMAVGILISYILGIWLSWHHLALASALLPFILFLLLLPLPESPTWLTNHGDLQAAEESMKWLDENYRTGCKLYDGHRKPKDLTDRKRRLSSTDMANLSARKSSINIENLRFSFIIQEKKKTESKEGLNDEERNPYFRIATVRPFLLTVALLILQQLSGIETVIFYTVDIFAAAESSVEGHLATVIVGIVQVVATVATLFLIDKVGRKPLLIVSAVVMAASMGALALYFYHEMRGEAENLGALPLVSLMFFTVGYSAGFGTIPYLIMSEIIPEKTRSLLSSVAGSLNFAMMFVIIKTYDGLRDTVQNKGVFGIYSVCSLLASFFVFGLVPETKGRTLEEIEEYFDKRKKSANPEDGNQQNQQ